MDKKVLKYEFKLSFAITESDNMGGGQGIPRYESLKPIEVIVSIYDEDFKIAKRMDQRCPEKGPFPDYTATGAVEILGERLKIIRGVDSEESTIDPDYWLNRVSRERIGLFRFSEGIYFSSSQEGKDKKNGVFHISGTRADIFPHGIGNILIDSPIDEIDGIAHEELKTILENDLLNTVIKPYGLRF